MLSERKAEQQDGEKYMLDDTPIFNVSALDELYELNEDDGTDLVQDLINDFVIQSNTLAQKLISNYEAKNLSEMEEAAHSLKSSSRVLGCLRLATIAERLEHFSRDRNFESTIPFMTELPGVLKSTRNALEAHKNPAHTSS